MDKLNDELQGRLDQILEKITSTDFLTKRGLGGDLDFHIFDYLPEHELQVRSHITFLLQQLEKNHTNLHVVHINLLSVLMDYLKERNFTQKIIELQKTKGDDALLKALKGPLHMDKFVPFLIKNTNFDQQDIVLVSGVGSVWPLLSAHNLLNNLHAKLGHSPMVMFYPGKYTGQSLSLFGLNKSNNYYRAFRLIP